MDQNSGSEKSSSSGSMTRDPAVDRALRELAEVLAEIAREEASRVKDHDQAAADGGKEERGDVTEP